MYIYIYTFCDKIHSASLPHTALYKLSRCVFGWQTGARELARVRKRARKSKSKSVCSVFVYIIECVSCKRARYQPRSKIAVCKVISCFIRSRRISNSRVVEPYLWNDTHHHHHCRHRRCRFRRRRRRYSHSCMPRTPVTTDLLGYMYLFQIMPSEMFDESKQTNNKSILLSGPISRLMNGCFLQ